MYFLVSPPKAFPLRGRCPGGADEVSFVSRQGRLLYTSPVPMPGPARLFSSAFSLSGLPLEVSPPKAFPLRGRCPGGADEVSPVSRQWRLLYASPAPRRRRHPIRLRVGALRQHDHRPPVPVRPRFLGEAPQRDPPPAPALRPALRALRAVSDHHGAGGSSAHQLTSTRSISGSSSSHQPLSLS